nr:hypothetical protein CFP56_67715 [Quercus suber]
MYGRSDESRSVDQMSMISRLLTCLLRRVSRVTCPPSGDEWVVADLLLWPPTSLPPETASGSRPTVRRCHIVYASVSKAGPPVEPSYRLPHLPNTDDYSLSDWDVLGNESSRLLVDSSSHRGCRRNDLLIGGRTTQ